MPQGRRPPPRRGWEGISRDGGDGGRRSRGAVLPDKEGSKPPDDRRRPNPGPKRPPAVRPMANVTTLSTEISDAFNKGKHGCALCSLWLDEEASVTERIRKDGETMDRDLEERVVAAS